MNYRHRQKRKRDNGPNGDAGELPDKELKLSWKMYWAQSSFYRIVIGCAVNFHVIDYRCCFYRRLWYRRFQNHAGFS
jgi:hypothetical protein